MLDAWLRIDGDIGNDGRGDDLKGVFHLRWRMMF
jgi:hypothetical protein